MKTMDQQTQPMQYEWIEEKPKNFNVKEMLEEREREQKTLSFFVCL